MTTHRKLTPDEISALERLGNSAENWDAVEVPETFSPSGILQSRLEGRVVLDPGARIVRSRVRNYRIGEGSSVEGTMREIGRAHV